MEKMVNLSLLALGLVFQIMCCCHGFRYGPIMSACGHMFPVGHGYDARNDTPPFTFYVNQTTYSPNDTIEGLKAFLDNDQAPPSLLIKSNEMIFELHSNLQFVNRWVAKISSPYLFGVFMNSSINPDNPTYEWFMEGVLIQVRTLNCDQEFSVGTFSVPECDDFLQTVDCFGLKNSAIRHYSHLHVYNKTFTWTAPSQPVGHVYFRATIARNQEKFWTNVFSVVIEDPTDSNTDKTLCPVISKQSEVASSATALPYNTFVMITVGLLLYCL